MKRLMGRIDQTNPEHAYFKLALEECPFDQCKCEDATTITDTSGMFHHIGECPLLPNCQSYAQWKFLFKMLKVNRFFSNLKVQSDVMKLYFLPIGPFPDFIHQYKSPCGRGLFELLCEYLRLFFTGAQVEALEEKNISSFHCTHRKHSFTNKDQFLVSDFFSKLRSMLPRDGCCIVALSWADLYPCEKMNFLLGQGCYEQFCCISSFGRFDPTFVKGFMGNTDGILVDEMQDIKQVDDSLMYKLIKIISHEVCHVFGLMHCYVFRCLMNESRSSRAVLDQPMVLCPFCMRKLRHACLNYSKCKGRFQIRSHFAAILHFLRSVFLEQNPDRNPQDEGLIETKRRVLDTTTWITNLLNQLSSSSSS